MAAGAKVLLYLVYGVVVAGMLYAIVHAFHSDKNATPATNQPSTNQQTANGSKPESAPANKSEPKSSGTSKSSSGSSSSSSSQSTPGNSSTNGLSNTGPGNTVALFMVASATGALVYRWRLVRRLN